MSSANNVCMRLILLLWPVLLPAVEVPQYILKGIAYVETKSYYRNGTLVYVDRRTGRAGDTGPFEMTPVAFKTVRKVGESLSRCSIDAKLAEDLAVRYLLWLYEGPAGRSWDRAWGL